MSAEHRRPQQIFSLFLLLFATVILSWPLILHMDTHMVGNLGHPGLQGDVFFQWNIGRQMEDGGQVDYLRSPYVRFPEGQAFRAKVAYSLHLALYTGFMLVVDLLTARNLAILLVLFLNAVAAWSLARERFRSFVFAFAFAILFAFSPFIYLKLNQGFLQKATLFYLPLFVLFFLRLLEEYRVRDAIGSAFFFMVGVLVYPPSAVYTTMLGAALLLGSNLRSLPLRRLVRPFAVFCLCVVPCVLLVLTTGKDDFVLVHRMNLDLEHFRSQGGFLDAFHPFYFFPYVGTFTGQPFQAFVERLPLGLPVLPLILAFVGALARRKWAAWLLAFSSVVFVVMLGPFLAKSGHLFLFRDHVVPLPYILFDQLPFGQAFRYPIRLFPWLQLAILLAAGEGFLWFQARVKTWRRWQPLAMVLPILVAVLMIVEPRIIFPEYRGFHVEKAVVPPYCAQPCVQQADAVLHLPYFAPGIHQYQFEAVLCDVAIMNPVKRAPSPITIPPADASEQRKKQFLSELGDSGIQCIVVHPDYYSKLENRRYAGAPSLGPQDRGLTGRDVEDWLESALGPPQSVVGSDVLLFELFLREPLDPTLVGAKGPHAQELVTSE